MNVVLDGDTHQSTTTTTTTQEAAATKAQHGEQKQLLQVMKKKKETAAVKEVEQRKTDLEEVKAMLAKLLKADKVEDTPKPSF